MAHDEPEEPVIERHALIQVELGPLPDGVTTWQDPVLDAITQAVIDTIERFEHPWEGSDAGMSGQIVKVILPADELGYTDPARPTVQWIGTRVNHYVSTHCLHGRHGDGCRKKCKYWEEHETDDYWCQCHCHHGEVR